MNKGTLDEQQQINSRVEVRSTLLQARIHRARNKGRGTTHRLTKKQTVESQRASLMSFKMHPPARPSVRPFGIATRKGSNRLETARCSRSFDMDHRAAPRRTLQSVTGYRWLPVRSKTDTSFSGAIDPQASRSICLTARRVDTSLHQNLPRGRSPERVSRFEFSDLDQLSISSCSKFELTSRRGAAGR